MHLIIGLDFDGTLVEHTYPEIRREVPLAFDYLEKLQDLGVKFVLFTMRSGKELDAAVAYIKHKGIRLFGVNTNPDQKSWTDSPKAYCHIYVDDAACGTPLMPALGTSRPMVNWAIVGEELLRNAYIQRANPVLGNAIYLHRNDDDTWVFSDLQRRIHNRSFEEATFVLSDFLFGDEQSAVVEFTDDPCHLHRLSPAKVGQVVHLAKRDYHAANGCWYTVIAAPEAYGVIGCDFMSYFNNGYPENIYIRRIPQ